MFPKVSVIIPAYNAGKYLEECIDSLMVQTVSVNEILIVDDGSTDDTRLVIEHLSRKFSQLRYIFLDENQGPGNARNIGLQNVSNPIVCFLDADDVCTPYRIEQVVECFMKIPQSAFCFAGYELNDPENLIDIDEKKEKYGRRDFIKNNKEVVREVVDGVYYILDPLKLLNAVLLERIGCPPTYALHRERIKRGIWFDPSLRVLEDVDFMCQLFFNNVIGVFIDAVHIYYRCHEEQLTRLQEKSIEEKLKKLFAVCIFLRKKLMYCKTTEQIFYVSGKISLYYELIADIYKALGNKDKALCYYKISFKFRKTFSVFKSLGVQGLVEYVLNQKMLWD